MIKEEILKQIEGEIDAHGFEIIGFVLILQSQKKQELFVDGKIRNDLVVQHVAKMIASSE